MSRKNLLKFKITKSDSIVLAMSAPCMSSNRYSNELHWMADITNPKVLEPHEKIFSEWRRLWMLFCWAMTPPHRFSSSTLMRRLISWTARQLDRTGTCWRITTWMCPWLILFYTGQGVYLLSLGGKNLESSSLHLKDVLFQLPNVVSSVGAGTGSWEEWQLLKV